MRSGSRTFGTYPTALVAALAIGCLANPVPVAPQVAADAIRAEATFDFVWTRLRDTYYDPDMGGLDWEAVRDGLRPRALASETFPELRSVLREMLDRLGESHFAILPGSVAAAFDPAGSAPSGDAETGIEVRWIEDELLVTRVRPESPAERSGVRAGWTLTAIGDLTVDSLVSRIRAGAGPSGEDRQLALLVPANAERAMLGPRGAGAELTFRDESGNSRLLEVPRASPPGEWVQFGNLPSIRVAMEDVEVPQADGLRISVLRWTAWFPTIVPWLAGVVDKQRDADGIILDLRGNPGGLGALVMGVGGHFLDESVSLGTMRTRETELRFVVNPQLVNPDGQRVEPYAGPLAVLVDPLTGSTSEFFAGGLQTLGRARVFGEPTAGQALPAVVIELPNGDRMMHVLADFVGPDGTRLEGAGVQPDVLAPPTREALYEGRDAALEAAVDWIRSTQETSR